MLPRQGQILEVKINFIWNVDYFFGQVGISIIILTGLKTVQQIVLNSNYHVVDLACVLNTIKEGLILAEQLDTDVKFKG